MEGAEKHVWLVDSLFKMIEREKETKVQRDRKTKTGTERQGDRWWNESTLRKTNKF